MNEIIITLRDRFFYTTYRVEEVTEEGTVTIDKGVLDPMATRRFTITVKEEE